MSILKRLFGPPDIDGLKRAGDVRGLGRALTHKESRIRKSAVQALSSLGAPEVGEALVVALDDEDAGVRRLACESLGRLGDEGAATRMIDLLHDGSTDVRLSAMEALALLDSGAAVKPLLRSALDRDFMFDGQLKRAVVSALERLGRSRPGDFVNALDDDNYRIRDVASQTLAGLEDPPVEPLLASFLHKGKGWGEACDLLAKRPDERTVAPMVRTLAHDDLDLRAGAAYTLGFIGDVRAVDALIDALRDPSAPVRAHAARSLGKLRDQRALGPLCAALGDESTVVFETVAEALGWLRDPRAVEPLLQVVEREIAGAKMPHDLWLGVPGRSSSGETISSDHVVRALGELGDTRAVKPLIALLAQWPARRLTTAYIVAAVTALERIGDARAVRPLISLLEGHEEEASRVEKEGFANRDTSNQSVHSFYSGYKVIDAVMHTLVSLRDPVGLEAVTMRLGSTLSFYSATDRDDGQWVFPVRNAAEREMKRYRTGST